MDPTTASTITRASSKQSYYTIRFLVDRPLVESAYQAYGYFRWVDDIIDTDSCSKTERKAFLQRQKKLLEKCYSGENPQDITTQEKMLVELIQQNPDANSGLVTYLSNMMQVMEFDASRRGRLISHNELNEYTFWLATAVTEAMHYFIGNGRYAPQDERRYLAVTAAHITHMLRDAIEDVQAGYYNIPREVLETGHIEPQDVYSDAYLTWVKKRVKLARLYFETGRDYIRHTQSLRCRLAGFAYTARFEWVLDTIEREGYRLRENYDDRKHLRSGLQIIWHALSSMMNWRWPEALPKQSPRNG